MGRAPLVLIVDDFADNRELYAEYLSHLGYDVAQAADGLEAVDKARALHPDVILMDLSMPGIDGLEAARRLKEDARTRGIEIIAVTAHAMRTHMRRAKEAGCDGFMAKPCLPDELAAQIRSRLAATRTKLDFFGRR